MESTLGEIQEREMVAIGSLKTAKREQAKRHRHCGEIEKVCGAPIIYRDGLGWDGSNHRFELALQSKTRSTCCLRLTSSTHPRSQATAQHRAELNKLEPERVKQGAEIKNLEKKVKEDTRAADRVEKDQRKQTEHVEGIEDDIQKLQEAEASQDKTAKDSRGRSESHLDESKTAEYETLKEQARGSTAAERSQLESLQRQHTADQHSLAQLENEHAELERKLDSDLERRDELDARLESMKTAAEKTHKDYLVTSKQVSELQQKTHEDSTRRKQLERELGEVNTQLRDARDDRRQSKHEAKMLECLQTLKRLFPGVHGRLSDLCKPVKRRYDRAVSVAAGKRMDAIVVDTQQTGYECIQYMREHRVGVASFIPLVGIKTPEVNERLRSLGGNSRLCIDVIQCAPEIKPAVLYAVDNTVVCEKLNDARDLCFRRKEKVKAVTLDGAVITKSGTMTGGNTPQHGNRGSRWDEQVHQELKSRRDELTAELEGLGRPQRQGSLEHELQTKMTLLKNKEDYALKDKEVTKEKIAGLNKQEKELKRQMARVAEERTRLGPSVAGRAATIASLESSILTTENSIFEAFSSSVGVADWREFEAGQAKATQEASEARRKLREHRAKLEAQLQYERTRDFATPLKRIQKRLSQTKARLEKVQGKQKSLAEREDTLGALLQKSEASLASSRSELEVSEVEIRQVQAERAAAARERATVSRKITAEETSVEQLRSKLQTVMQKAKVEEVDLPMMDRGSEGEGKEQEQEREDEGGGEAVQGNGLEDAADGEPQVDANLIDYSKLRDERRKVRDHGHSEEVRREYELAVTVLQSELESMQPNMKAVERFDDVLSRHKTSAEEFDKAKEEARDATAAFHDIKQKRHDAFMSCFNHVSQELRAIYRDLTKSSKVFLLRTDVS